MGMDWAFGHPGLEDRVIDENGNERKIWATKELYVNSVKESLQAPLQLYSEKEKERALEQSSINILQAVKLCTPQLMHVTDTFNDSHRSYDKKVGIALDLDACSAAVFFRTDPSTTYSNSCPTGIRNPDWHNHYPTLTLCQLRYVQEDVDTFRNLYNNMRDTVLNVCDDASLPAKYFRGTLGTLKGMSGPEEHRSDELGSICGNVVTKFFQALRERVGSLSNFSIKVTKKPVPDPEQTSDREINCWMENDEFITSCFELATKSNTSLLELALGHPNIMQLPDSTRPIDDIKQQILQASQKAERDIGDISNYLTAEQKADLRADCVLEAENAVDYPSKLRYLTSERLKIAANGYFRGARRRNKTYTKAVAVAEKRTAQLWCKTVEDLQQHFKQGLAATVARACPVVGVGDADCLVAVRVDVNQDWDAWDSNIHYYTNSEPHSINILTDKVLQFDLNVTPLSEVFTSFLLLAARKLSPKFEALITGGSNREDNDDGGWQSTYSEPRFATLQRIAVFEAHRKFKLDLFNLGYRLRNMPDDFVSVRTNLKFETKPVVVRRGSEFRSTVLRTEMDIDGERTTVYVKMHPIANWQAFDNELRAYKRIAECGKTGEFAPELVTASLLLDMESIGEYDELKSGAADYKAAGLTNHPRGLDMMKRDQQEWFKAKSGETYAQDTSMECVPDCPFKGVNNGGLAHENTTLPQTVDVPARELGHVLDHIGRPGVRLATNTLVRYLSRYCRVGHNTKQELAMSAEQAPLKVSKQIRPKLLLVTTAIGCTRTGEGSLRHEQLERNLDECGIFHNGLDDSNSGKKGGKWYVWDFGNVTFKDTFKEQRLKR